METQGKVTLCIYVTSEVPDVYINTMVYCLDQFDIGKVVLLGIVEDRGHKAKTGANLDTIKARVAEQLSLLQQGKYLYKEQKSKTWKDREVTIDSHDKARYAKIASSSIDTRVIVYDQLEEEVAGLLSGGRCIFDVSGILKGYLIDIFAILLTRGIDDLYAFELRLHGRTYDEKELIHNLSLDRRDYEFVKLPASKYTHDVTVRKKSQENGDKDTVAALRHEADTARGEREKLVEAMGDSYASNVLTIYFLTILLVILSGAVALAFFDFALLPKYLSLGATAIGFAGYLVTLVVQALVQKEFSLTPGHLYKWLKQRKMAQFQSPAPAAKL